MQRLCFGSMERLATVVLVIVGFCGCGEAPQGGSPKVPVYKATAKVTYKGKAVDGAIVKLINTEPFKPGASGRTDAQGACSLMTYDANDGAPAGSYMVMVTKPPKVAANVASASQDSADYVPPPENAPPPPPTKPELPEKYNNPARSPLKANVTAEGPNDFTFDLAD